MRLIDGRQAKAARVILGMTVLEMAEAAGIAKNSVMRVEALKGIRVGCNNGGYSVQALSDAIEERGVVCDVMEGQPIVRFATTPPPPKYRKKQAAA